MTYERVPIGRLYTLLNDELRQDGAAVCVSCRMPLPIPSEQVQGGANWRIELPPSCPLGCHDAIVKAAARVWVRYGLAQGITQQHAS